MGLLHWWDLNNNLLDKGNADNVSLTNNGATVDVGKLGKSYYFNGSSNVKRTFSASTHPLGSYPKHFSLCFWIKLSENWTSWGQAFTIGNEATAWTDIKIGVEISYDKIAYFTVSDGTSSGYVGTSGPKQSLSVEKWYHIAATYSNKVMKLYINGEPASTHSYTTSLIPNLSSSSVIAIGGNGSEKCKCWMNDVRIYDHELSKAEIKDISRALVLHYSFDDTLVEPTTNIITGIKSVHGKASLESGRVKINWSPSGGDSYIQFTWSPDIKANSVYTLSFDCEGLKSGEVATFAVSNLSAASYNIALKNGRNSLTFTAGSDLMNDINTYNRLFFDDKTRTEGAVFYLSNFQLEEKDHATPYVNGSRNKTLYNEACQIQPTTVKNLSLSTDSAVGNYSLKCSNTFIRTMSSTNGQETMTISAWVKSNSWTGGCVVVGGIYLVIESGKLSTYCYSKSPAGYHSSSAVMELGKWYHVAIVYTESKCLGYVNGSKVIDVDCTGIPNHGNHDKKDIGMENDSGRILDGYIDDVRIYHTALSQDDITHLYNCRLSVSPTYSAISNTDYSERHTSFEPSKKLISAVNIVQPSTMKLTDGSEWLCIFNHELRDDKTYFTNSTEAAMCTNKENRYSLLNYIDQFKSTDNTYEFILSYPDRGQIRDGFYNRWTQTSNPNTASAGSVSGFTSINAKWGTYNKGIAKSSSSSTYMNTNAGGSTWFGAIGQYGRWTTNDTSQIPAADGNSSESTQLWIRIDNTTYKGYFKTYDNGAMLTSNLEEI